MLEIVDVCFLSLKNTWVVYFEPSTHGNFFNGVVEWCMLFVHNGLLEL